MVDLSIILAIIITAVVVGVPFYAGARSAIKKAVAKHKTVEGKIIAGIEAMTKYVEDHKTADAELVTMIHDIEKLIEEYRSDGKQPNI
jgi:hypothetical protein